MAYTESWLGTRVMGSPPSGAKMIHRWYLWLSLPGPLHPLRSSRSLRRVGELRGHIAQVFLNSSSAVTRPPQFAYRALNRLDERLTTEVLPSDCRPSGAHKADR